MRGDVAKKDADGLVAVRIVETYLPAEVWDWYYGQIMAGRSPREINPEHYELQYVYDEAMVNVPQRASVAEIFQAVRHPRDDGRIGRRHCRHIQDWLYDHLKTEDDPYDFNFAVKDWIEQEGIMDYGKGYAELTDVMPKILLAGEVKTFTNRLKESGGWRCTSARRLSSRPGTSRCIAGETTCRSLFVHFTNRRALEHFTKARPSTGCTCRPGRSARTWRTGARTSATRRARRG